MNFQSLSLLGAIYNASTIPRRELPKVHGGHLLLSAYLWGCGGAMGPSAPCSLADSYMLVHRAPAPSQGKALLDLVKQAQDEQRPLAIFPELARSNADAVLTFVDGVFAGLEESTSAVRTHVLGFRYAPLVGRDIRDGL